MPRIFGRQTSPSFILNDNMTFTSLDARAEIDVIDEQLVDLLASRFRAIAQVGIVKKELDLPPADCRASRAASTGGKSSIGRTARTGARIHRQSVQSDHR